MAKNKMTDNDLKKRIIEANRDLHGLPGYVASYDTDNPYMVNPFAQSIFLRDLERIRRFHDRRSGSEGETLSALDLGAGTGNLTFKLIHLGYRVKAVDLADAMLGQLRAKADADPDVNNDDVVTEVCEAEEFLTRTSERYDAIVMCSFLHHLPDYEKTLNLCAARLNPNGMIYFAHEPLPPKKGSILDRVLETIDHTVFLVRRGKLASKLKDRIAPVPGNSDSKQARELSRLADYHVYENGIEPRRLMNLFNQCGLYHTLVPYALMANSMTTRLANMIGQRDMLRGFAWRGKGER